MKIYRDHWTPDIIKAAIPASVRFEQTHPAKRTFQAIWIEVNGELETSKVSDGSFPELLAPGGRNIC